MAILIKVKTESNVAGIYTIFDAREPHADDIQVTENGDLKILQDGKVVRAFAPSRWVEANKL